MPLQEDNKVIEMKYAGVPFGRMTEEQRLLSAHSIMLKIHVITGWTIPLSDEMLDILVDQLAKKLNEQYKNVNESEIEYAFRNRGIEVKDWGKQLHLTMIDDVLLPYLETRFDLSRTEENLFGKFQYALEDKKELTEDEWNEWISDVRKYDFKLIPCAIYDYLVKKELLILSNKEKHEYMDRAIAHLTGTLDAMTKESIDFAAMKKEGAYSAEVTASLITISKRFAVQDYLNRNK